MPSWNVDILMKIVDKSGGAIAAAGQSTIDSDDPYTNDFKHGKFFELEDFDIGIGLEDTDSSSKTSGVTSTAPGSKPSNQTDTKPKGGKFSKWSTVPLSTSSGSQPLFPIQMDEITVTRQVDQASPLLFQRCFLVQEFASATIVVRRAGGPLVGAGSNIGALPFLRLDFKPVLITSVDWDAGEVIKEKLKMVCREVKVQCRPQTHGGKAGDNVSTTQQLTLVKSS